MKLSIFKNRLKTTLIMTVIFVLLSVVIYYITYALGYGRYAVSISLALSLVTSLISYWNSSKIVLKMNRAKSADQSIHQDAYNALRRVSQSAGIDMPKLYVMEDSSPNAFATGRNPKNSVVCVTTGLLEKLDYYQLEGVIAHEVAHITNYDILLSTIASVMIGVIIMISDIWTRSFWFRSARRSQNDRDNGANAIMMIIGLVFIIIAPIAGQLLRFALSRNREYLADSTGAKYTGNPEGLASALEIISSASKPIATASNATANMFISDPMKALNKRNMLNLFSTHPPIEKRVERLRELKYNMY